MIKLLEDVLKSKNISYRRGVLTALLCSFRIGGIASLLIEPDCTLELIEAVRLCHNAKAPYYIVGRGTNLLFPDEDIKTVLISTARLQGMRERSDGIFAGCGTPLILLAYHSARCGFGDLVFAGGIPGSLGGGVFMNAGAYGGALSDVIKSVCVYDPLEDKIKTYFNNQLSFSYRKSIFQEKPWVILSADLLLKSHGDPTELLQRIRQQNRARSAAQPLDHPSAGSCFLRPAPQLFAARILDELGLKGLQIGGAAVSQKHAGFVVNLGGATAHDVMQLIEKIQKIVQKERGILLQPELRFVPCGK